jgi:hypothetical protein
MPNSSSTSSSKRKILFKAISFCGLALVVYLVLIALLVAPQPPWLYRILHCPLPGDPGSYTRQRFEDARTRSKTDILVAGASVAYHGYDPRIFEKEGIQLQLLASANQRPMITYHALRRFVPQLKPRLVIIDVAYCSLGKQPLEGFYDYAIHNTPGLDLVQLGFELAHPYAVSLAVSRYFRPRHFDQAEVQSHDYSNYIQGGFLEDRRFADQQAIQHGWFRCDTDSSTLPYLRDTIEYLRSQNVAVILVTLPQSPKVNYREGRKPQYRQEIVQLVETLNIRHYDFSRLETIAGWRDFADDVHMRISGAQKFSQALLERIRSDRLLSAQPIGGQHDQPPTK